MAVYYWADELTNFISNPNTEIFAVPDSGMYFDVENLKTKVRVTKLKSE